MPVRERADIVVVGGINTDFLVQGPRLPAPGDSMQGHLFLESLGGKGANGAVGAARLGARVALVGRVGMDARGLALLEQLEGEGVDIGAVARDPTAMTGVALEMVDEEGQRQRLAAPGANRCLKPSDIMSAEERLAAARVLLVQLEVPLEAVSAAVHHARAAGTHVVLDPAPAMSLPEDLLEAVHVIRPNAEEAEALTGVEVRDRDSARRAAENLLRRGVGGAVVAAPDGSLVLSTMRLGALGGLPMRDQVESRLALLGPRGLSTGSAPL